MNIELHMIQSFAPSCLNRDDTNTPKSCMFGGVRRARISSQCLKRATRLYMRDALSIPTGVRTRLLASRKIAELLVSRGRPEEQAKQVAAQALKCAGFVFDDDGIERTRVGLYLSDEEIEELARAILDDWDALLALAASQPEKKSEQASRRDKRKADTENITPALKQAVKEIGNRVSVADIALFGRMVAENTNMNVDAACQVAHAISTHAVETEMDFYTAVDDLQPEAEPGAGMMGILEYNSACFYRYALISRDQLLYNLRGDAELANRAIVGFVRGSIEAIPTGRQNSCAAQNPPDYVHLRVGDDMPLSLANAFEKPVRPTNGKSVTEASIHALRDYQRRVYTMFGPPTGEERYSSTYPVEGAVPVSDLLSWLEGSLRRA